MHIKMQSFMISKVKHHISCDRFITILLSAHVATPLKYIQIFSDHPPTHTHANLLFFSDTFTSFLSTFWSSHI